MSEGEEDRKSESKSFMRGWNETFFEWGNEYLAFNPLVPSAHQSVGFAKISILKLEGIVERSFKDR